MAAGAATGLSVSGEVLRDVPQSLVQGDADTGLTLTPHAQVIEHSGESRKLISPLDFRVFGRARPQGSVTPRPNGTVAYSARLLEWRQNVAETVLRQLGGRPGPRGPLVDWTPVPEGVPVVVLGYAALAGDPIGREAGDVDKITRALLDALTDAQVWDDDRQVVWAPVLKRACGPGEPEHVVLRVEW